MTELTFTLIITYCDNNVEAHVLVLRKMVLNNTNKNNFILLEVFASVFTVSSYFTDNPSTTQILNLTMIESRIDVDKALWVKQCPQNTTDAQVLLEDMSWLKLVRNLSRIFITIFILGASFYGLDIKLLQQDLYCRRAFCQGTNDTILHQHINYE